MYFTEKIEAVELRKSGLSYSEIRNKIPVSKSTLSLWLKDIVLSDEYKKRLSKLQATGYIGAKKQQKVSAEKHRLIRESAEKEIKKLINNPFFVCGLMLYWAEGDKRSGTVQFSNSDPEMIKIMMRWFREICEVKENKFRIGLFIHALHIDENYLEFWTKVTAVPISQFNKPFVKPTILSIRKNKLYEGTCVIKVHDKQLWSKIIGWLNGFKNNAINHV